MKQQEKKQNKTGVPEEKLTGSARVRREVYDWAETFAFALAAVVLVFTFLLRFVTVDGESMMNTLHNGDRLIITSTPYTPKRGDIVVIHDTEDRGYYETFGKPIIKRVIATEGETVRIDYENWEITVTDKEGHTFTLDESAYVNFENTARYPNPELYPHSVQPNVEHTVADGCVFVCGDNRNHSLDSRYVGDIDERKVLGKVLFRVTCGDLRNTVKDFGPIRSVTYAG